MSGMSVEPDPIFSSSGGVRTIVTVLRFVKHPCTVNVDCRPVTTIDGEVTLPTTVEVDPAGNVSTGVTTVPTNVHTEPMHTKSGDGRVDMVQPVGVGGSCGIDPSC